MILPLTPRARAKVVKSQQSDSVLATYATKPVEFAADILGVTLTPDQELILDKLMHSAEVNVQSSHGQGKTSTSGSSCSASRFLPFRFSRHYCPDWTANQGTALG
jgi:hypothetical protein